MPLSPPAEREAHHTRRYEFNGYRRKDGLWDIEGHMTDTKTYSFYNDHRGEVLPQEPIHDMWIRLTVDDDFVVHDVEAATDAAPFAACPAITPNFRKIIGLTVGRGWRTRTREHLGGVQGCTHLLEMLDAMATVTFQTLYPARAKKKQPEEAAKRRSPLINSCYAFRSDGEVVRTQFPRYYTGGGR